MLPLDGATAIAPIEATGCESKIGFQVRPALVVFQTPPPTEPKYNVLGCPGTPLPPLTRPPRNGPMLLQRRPPKTAASTLPCCARTRGSAAAANGAVRA